MGVFDNNPLYGSFTFGGGYSATGSPKLPTTYLADFLFRHFQRLLSGNYFEAHLRQTIESAYVQDDWKVLPNLTLNLGLRWEYGSPYSEQNNLISNWDPASQTVFTINPTVTTANAAHGITPTAGIGVYGKTLINPDLNDFAPRIGFAYAPFRSALSVADSALAMCTTRAQAPATSPPLTPRRRNLQP